LFKDNGEAGKFVNALANATDSNINKFLLRNNKQGRSLFIDMGVYTKNRNFRIFQSSKIGKKSPLVLAKACKYPFASDKQLFLESLVCNTELDVLPKKLGLEFCTPIGLPIRQGRTPPASKIASLASEKSPYPKIDSFILQELKQRPGKLGYFRNWILLPELNLLVYNIAGNRFCENLQREHKSNHIMLLVDLHQGVYFQKCHDPECRAMGFKSLSKPIPVELLPDKTQLFQLDPAHILTDRELWDAIEKGQL